MMPHKKRGSVCGYSQTKAGSPSSMNGWLLAGALLAALALAAQPLRADVILFDDAGHEASDPNVVLVTVIQGIDTSDRLQTFGCPVYEYGCRILSAPTGYTLNGSDLSVGSHYIGEPDGVLISDHIDVSYSLGGTSYQIIFAFDIETAGYGLRCSDVPGNLGCFINEDGTMQLAGNIFWADNAGNHRVDTILFRTYVAPVSEPVPEPASMLLLITGLAGAGVSKLRSRGGKRDPSGYFPSQK